MKKFLLFAFFVGLVALGGAAYYVMGGGGGMTFEVDVEPSADSGEGQYRVPKRERSSLAVRLDLPLDALALMANEQIPDDISGMEQKNLHQRIRNGQVQYQIVPGDIAFRNSGVNLGFAVPIRGAALASGDLDIRFLQLPIQGRADLAGTIYGTIEPRFTTDWRVTPNLIPDLDLTQAEFTLGGLGTIAAEEWIERAANPMIQEEAEKLAQSLDLRQDAQEIWNRVHLNEKISEEPEAWVVVNPHSISMGPIDYGNSQTISVTLGMEADSYVASQPANVFYPETIPDLVVSNENISTNVRLPIIADLEALNRKIRDQSFRESNSLGAFVEITEPRVMVGRDGFIFVGIHLLADSGRFGRRMTGRIWLKGRPELDVTNQVLGISGVDLTQETREAMPRQAAAAIKRMLTEAVENELEVDLRELLVKAEAEIQKQLTMNSPEQVQLIVERPQLRLLDLYTVTQLFEDSVEADPAIVVVVGATGGVTARLSGL